MTAPLVTVVVQAGDHPAPALDRALFALGGQRHRPLRVVLAGGSDRGAAADARLLERHAALGGFEAARTPSVEAALREAHGLLLTLSPPALLYPGHLVRLVSALERSPASRWALASGRLALLAPGRPASRPHVLAKRDPWGQRAPGLLRGPPLPQCAALFDLSRAGSLPPLLLRAGRSQYLPRVALAAALGLPALAEGPPSFEWLVERMPKRILVEDAVRAAGSTLRAAARAARRRWLALASRRAPR